MFSNFEQLFHFVDDMPPRRGCGRLRRVTLDEKASSTPHAHPPQGKPQFPPRFQVPLIPQPGFFPPIILEVFQA